MNSECGDAVLLFFWVMGNSLRLEAIERVLMGCGLIDV